jgi:TetR/AcrR family transcriptional regulator, transcriptional repressor for nem operon
MAASVTSERPGKRDRLVAGARETIYRQGFEATTIADIAEASDVPLGNVYYYFKSKDELVVAAAIDSYAQESRERLSWLEQQHRTPRARLKELVRLLVSQPRSGGAVRLPEREPVLRTRQARQRPRPSLQRAFALLASYEGTALLTNTFRDPELMIREGRRLGRWIDSLARDSKDAPTG